MKTLTTGIALIGLTAAMSSNETVRRTDAPFGDKKGLAYNNGDITNILSRGGSATWAYNWGTYFAAPKFQQIPMYHDPGYRQGDRNNILNKIASGDTPWVLGYNEPDVRRANGGCETSPAAAASSWGNDMFIFADRGAKLVCPGISSWDSPNGDTGGPSGFTWLRQFAGNNPGQFRCGAQAIHWYGGENQNAQQQAQDFINYVGRAHSIVNSIFQTNMDLWITEFSPLPINNAQVMSDFLAIVIPWLNAQDYVARYSPFMAEYLVSGGGLNIAGQTFVNAH
jgi:hypothetical protein